MGRPKVSWRTPRWALNKFTEMSRDLDGLDPSSDLAYAIRDEIRSLPGFPANAPEDSEFIIEVTTVR